MSGITDLIAALRDPATLAVLDGPRWTALLSVAKGEVLLGTLAAKSAGLDLPPAVADLLAAQRQATAVAHTRALWEADRARAALAPLGIAPVLLKGTAYIAAGLTAGQGRQIGDLDILVPRDRLDEAEVALLAAGWTWLKPDPYDDAYYRKWMHELPPLIHGEREAMIDVHHTILPLTHRATPDAAWLVAHAETLPLPRLFADPVEPAVTPAEYDPDVPPHAVHGQLLLDPSDMVIHCAAHVMADGDLAGGLRNLWDFHCLTTDFARRSGGKYWDHLEHRAFGHGLLKPFQRTVRLAHQVFSTAIPPHLERGHASDGLFLRRLTARNDWGRESRPATRAAFYLRSHWLRMPPLMLARHLWTKWRRT